MFIKFPIQGIEVLIPKVYICTVWYCNIDLQLKGNTVGIRNSTRCCDARSLSDHGF